MFFILIIGNNATCRVFRFICEIVMQRATISFGGTQRGQRRFIRISALPDQAKPSRPTPTP
jgi:hypothetical protein